MKLILNGPNIHKVIDAEGLSEAPSACYMEDDKGLPMIFVRDTPSGCFPYILYQQAHSVLQLKYLKEFQA